MNEWGAKAAFRGPGIQSEARKSTNPEALPACTAAILSFNYGPDVAAAPTA